MEKWEGFQQCPGCGYDLLKSEGERACAWGDCAYLPDELKVTCPECTFNYLTMEGNPPCEDPMTCEHAAEPLAHIENLRRWVAEQQAPAG